MPTRFTTRQDHHHRVQRVMIHVDRHLDRPLDLDAMARVACLSPHHFQRVFLHCTGESPRQHIYRRRMEMAARRLSASRERIIDIALAAGYASPTAFCKAFNRWSGKSPRRFRERPVSMDGYASFRTSPYRATGRPVHWRPRLCVLPERQMVFVEKQGLQDGSLCRVGQAAALELEALLDQQGLRGRVRAWLSTFPRRPRGITDPRVVIQVGVVLDGPATVAAPLRTRAFGGGRWAVFLYCGPYHYLFQAWNRAYFGALPALYLVARDADPFEHYLDAGSERPEKDLRTLLHLPIH